MKQNKVLILGGGASGLAAAIVAARGGAQVTLLERGDRVGKKLLATGNGRCNLANLGEPRYYGDPAFARAVLEHMPVADLLRFFESVGLPTRPDAAGRVYPGCNQAAAVLDALRAQLDALNARTVTGTEVTALRRTDAGWQAVTRQGAYTADSVIVCCGGLAAPKLGAVNAYGLLTGLGCRLVPPAPALTPLETDTAPLRGLSGLRLAVTLTLCGREPVAAAQGEMLFADYGVSGVCAMQLARDAENLLRRGEPATLYIDFSPALGLGDYRMDRLPPKPPEHNRQIVADWLRRRARTLPGDDLLLGALPRLLREKLKKAPPADLPRLLCAYPLRVTGVRGYDQAQVTQGGIDCRDFDPATLAHRRLPGLYACGEILNVDGDCGGYNLQFAFACGLLAGGAAARPR